MEITGESGKPPISGKTPVEKISLSRSSPSVSEERARRTRRPPLGSRARTRGSRTRTSGSRSRASGSRSRASGSRSRASGSRSRASGYRTRASGYRTRASGYRTRASGYRTRASGWRTRASGCRTQASSPRPPAVAPSLRSELSRARGTCWLRSPGHAPRLALLSTVEGDIARSRAAPLARSGVPTSPHFRYWKHSLNT